MKEIKSMERLTVKRDKPSINSQYAKKEKVWTADCIEKLGKYEDAEEQGLLLRLPVAIGDKVYEIIEETVPGHHFYISEYEIQDVSAKAVKYADDWFEYGYPNLYLTREEAEQALKQIGE